MALARFPLLGGKAFGLDTKIPPYVFRPLLKPQVRTRKEPSTPKPAAVCYACAMRIDLDTDEAAYLRGRIVDDTDPLANRVWLKLAQASNWTPRCGVCSEEDHETEQCGIW